MPRNVWIAILILSIIPSFFLGYLGMQGWVISWIWGGALGYWFASNFDINGNLRSSDMREFGYYLCQRRDNNKWDILDQDHELVARCDTQEQAMQFIEEATGTPPRDWTLVKVKDETDGSAITEFERRQHSIH